MYREDTKTIMLGSGNIFTAEYDGTIPEDPEMIIAEAEEVGAIQGGCTLEYKPTFFTEKDDSGEYEKSIMTEDEATLKLGLITFNGETIANLNACSTTRKSGKYRITDIGGAENYSDKSRLFIFRHTDKKDGNVYVIIYGENQAGFSLAWAKDKGSKLEPELKCKPMTNGVRIRYIEQIADTETVSETEATEEAQG